METTLTNSDAWESRAQVKKGKIGEQLVKEYLENNGFIVYEPQTEGAHGFDKLAIKDKRQAVIAECKTKARRNKYADTGINERHLEEYQYISKKHNLPVFIFFVDEHLGKIYGNYILKLLEPKKINGKYYPSRENGIIYFPLSNMRLICEINKEATETIKQHSTRRYDYM